ncbi:MAG: Zn-dependent hydrolase [Tissierellia bacterium]|nr:Zn-dependent hydrolase [Tissierellia bacterium]
MKINDDRLQENFDVITSISATDIGCTRLSYSYEDQQVRNILIKKMTTLGLLISIDGVGNIRGKYSPSNAKGKSLLIGSHIDTVVQGGKYDGLMGTLSSLEVITTIVESDINLKKPLEIIVFAEEEGSNFGSTMLGSKFLAGDLTYHELENMKNFDGVPAIRIMQEAGMKPNIDTVQEMDDSADMMLEYHVEQGGVLEDENRSIGIVEAIAGMQTMKVSVIGQSNHAGTTPMHLRKDPLVTASKIIHRISTLPNVYGGEKTVMTVGKVLVEPNGSNVIPSKVEFYVDIRDVIKEKIENTYQRLSEYIYSTCANAKLICYIEKAGESKPVQCSEKLRSLIEMSARNNDLPYICMNSGAVHDCAMLAKKLEIGMIFVPSRNGISHNPDEFTEWEDVVMGANLLLDVVLELTQ